MTISLKTKATGNANLDLVFDPYVQGTHPADTGLLADASLGSGDIAIRYAPIVYGSSAAPTGLLTKQSGHADINTLFAAYGTAQYGLVLNGQTYEVIVTPGGINAIVIISFTFNTSTTYQLYDLSNPAGGTDTPTSNFSTAFGSLPAGSSKCKVTLTYLGTVGDTNPGSVSNNYSAFTTISSGSAFSISLTAPLGAVHQASYSCNIQIQNSGGTVISTTNCTLILRSTG